MSLNENSSVSGNAHSNRTLKRMKIAYGDTSIQFAINPEDYTQTEPNKATITQTKGGAWIDAWGAGITEIVIKGTTGVKGVGGTNIDIGYQRWKELRNLIRSVYDSIKDGESVTELIKFYNYTDNEFWYCYPTQAGIELYRSKSRPNIYQYTINLWAIRRIGQPASSSGVIGNPNSNAGGGNSQTSRNTTTHTQSGGRSTSRNTLRNTEVDNTTITNTKTKSILGLQEDCLQYLTELEPLIGGKSGKISPVTGFQCTQSITMQSSGTVSNVEAFTGESLSSDKSLLLVETKFSSRVSVETYTLYTQIKMYSPEVLSPAYSLVAGLTTQQRVIQAISTSTAYDSTIYQILINLRAKSITSKNETNYVKLVLLESMMVYGELFKMQNQSDEELSTTLTMTNMSILINNIRALIMYFSLKIKDNAIYQVMDLSAELRQLEKIMTQVRTNIVDYL